MSAGKYWQCQSSWKALCARLVIKWVWWFYAQLTLKWVMNIKLGFSGNYTVVLKNVFAELYSKVLCLINWSLFPSNTKSPCWIVCSFANSALKNCSESFSVRTWCARCRNNWHNVNYEQNSCYLIAVLRFVLN